MATRRKAKFQNAHRKISRINRIVLSFGALFLIIIAIGGYIQYKLITLDYDDILSSQTKSDAFQDLELSKRPFKGEQFPLDQIFGKSPTWGTLNSGHYFGLKLSSPESIESSLMWFKNQLNRQGGLNIRHLCDQNDGLSSYSWIRHDFWSFGEQIIEDEHYRLKTSFVKNPKNNLEWKAQVDIELVNNKLSSSKIKPLSVIQYLTTNHPDDKIYIKPSLKSANNVNNFGFGGYSKDVGKFELNINFQSSMSKLIHHDHYRGYIDKYRYPVNLFLQSQMVSTVKNKIRLFTLSGDMDLRIQNQHVEPNIVAYQMTVEAPASFIVELKQIKENSSTEHITNYSVALGEKREEFDNKFLNTFDLTQLNESPEIDRLAKVALSNMIGSVGYFYGKSFISASANQFKYVPYGPIQLLTGVPSRSFFPRGFLWDEGFHNILISEWDSDLSNKIIQSWFNIMNINGWIPREVILGVESMRRVPQEFLIQGIANANPPAMFIALEKMYNQGSLYRSTLESIYPKLKAWYSWFNHTQSGPKESTFRWRGRDELSVNMLNPKTLTSGLDDYPRASHPSPSEYHIDLRCWMAMAARTLSKLAEMQGDTDYHGQISKEAAALSDNSLLDELHWSDKYQMYCDYGHNTEKAELVRVSKTRRSAQTQELETYTVLERHSTGQPIFGCVPEFGYVSLFPMLLNILDHRSEKLGIILTRLRNDKELWSPYGIRSLSASSVFYNKYNTEQDKPYWRGAVWINMNYLILSALKSYSKLDGPYKEKCSVLFIELKENLVNNVLKEFSKTNYIWENFDDQTGQGKGSHPFTGWSSLILLIMSSK